MKKTLIYTSRVAFLSMEAQSLPIQNSGGDTELYLHTNIGGEHDEYLVQAQGHESITFSVVNIWGNLIEELDKNEEGYIQFWVINVKHREFCTYKPSKNTFSLKKGTKSELLKKISDINDRTIYLNPANCFISNDEQNKHR